MIYLTLVDACSYPASLPKPGQPYTALSGDTDHCRVQQIGLTLDEQWDALKALVGQKVSVSGAIQLEPPSPYYLNGTLVEAKSVRHANGTVLTRKPLSPSSVLPLLPGSISLSRLHHAPPRDGHSRLGTTMAIYFPARRPEATNRRKTLCCPV